jgi:hypothetical protein
LYFFSIKFLFSCVALKGSELRHAEDLYKKWHDIINTDLANKDLPGISDAVILRWEDLHRFFINNSPANIVQNVWRARNPTWNELRPDTLGFTFNEEEDSYEINAF